MAFLRNLTTTLLISLSLFSKDGYDLESATAQPPAVTIERVITEQGEISFKDANFQKKMCDYLTPAPTPENPTPAEHKVCRFFSIFQYYRYVSTTLPMDSEEYEYYENLGLIKTVYNPDTSKNGDFNITELGKIYFHRKTFRTDMCKKYSISNCGSAEDFYQHVLSLDIESEEYKYYEKKGYVKNPNAVDDTVIVGSKGVKFEITDAGRKHFTKQEFATKMCEKFSLGAFDTTDAFIEHVETLSVNSDEFKYYESIGYVRRTSEGMNMRHDLAVLGSKSITDKIEDPITGMTIATCKSDYSLDKETNNTLDTLPADLREESLQGCAASADYNGACWVQYGGYLDSEYKIKICHIGTTGTSGSNKCVTLGPGRKSGSFHTNEIQSFGLDNIGYDGPYENSSKFCPDTTTAENALGYAFIYEATDPKYIDYFDYYENICRPLIEKQTPGTCMSEANCYCDIECRENGFMPRQDSDVWKNATSSQKDCFLCHKTHRAVEFYCKKVYDCIHRKTSSDGTDGGNKVYSAVANFAFNPSKRGELKKLYGRGQYLCGYYNGIRCGCAKLQLNGGPRHMLRIARNDDRLNRTCEVGDVINNPECHLFQDIPHVRQFYNEKTEDDETGENCSHAHNAEFGYKKRGTFLSPRLVVQVADSERNVGYDYDTIKNSKAFSKTVISDIRAAASAGKLEEKDGNADYFYNRPIGVARQFDDNNHDYNYPKAKKIIFSPFFPKIYSIGAKEKIRVSQDKCEYRFTGNVYYFMIRLEFNISTGVSSLVAYQVIPKNTISASLTGGRVIERADGSILKFAMNRAAFFNTFDPNEIKDDHDTSDKSYIARDFKDYYPTYSELEFVNIGSVERPPIKYGYAGETITMNTPLYLRHESGGYINSANREMRVKLYFSPVILKDVNTDDPKEFEKDSLLPTRNKDLTIAGVNSSATSPANTNTNVNNTTLLYMKRFTVDYSNECSILQNYAYDAKSIEFLKEPPKNEYTCRTQTGYDKIACYTAFILAKQCNSYINCLFSNNSLKECYNGNPPPKLKITGAEGDLYEYQKNKDFRSKAYICITEGFELADKLSKYSNTRLFGDFGDPVKDYTVRFLREKNSPFLGTPTIPFSLMGKEPEFFKSGEDQIDRKLIFQMVADYFSAATDEERYKILINHLKSTPMVDRKTRLNYYDGNAFTGTYKIYNEPVITSYFQECASGTLDCRKKFEVAHRTIEETESRLCIAANNMQNDSWDVKARDLGTDYDVYVPLRCEYVHFQGFGAGGAGLTSEDETHCFAYYRANTFCFASPIPPIPWGMIHQKYIPRYDATGGGGGFIDGIIDLTKIPIFDGYLHISTGTKTKMARTAIPRGRDHCQGGLIGWCFEDDDIWITSGGTHAYWNIENWLESDKNSKRPKDLKKGNTEVGITWYGDSSVLPSSIERVNYELQRDRAKDELRSITAFESEVKTQMCEYYYIASLFAIRREMADNHCTGEVLDSTKISEVEKTIWGISSASAQSFYPDVVAYANDSNCVPTPSKTLDKIQNDIDSIQNVIDLINNASSDVLTELRSCCSGLTSKLSAYKSDLVNIKSAKSSFTALSFANAMSKAKSYCGGVLTSVASGSTTMDVDLKDILDEIWNYYNSSRKSCAELMETSAQLANTKQYDNCKGDYTFKMDVCSGLDSSFFGSGKIDSKYKCLLCKSVSDCNSIYQSECDNVKSVLDEWSNFACVDSSNRKCTDIINYLNTYFSGSGYENFICRASTGSDCDNFKNNILPSIIEDAKNFICSSSTDSKCTNLITYFNSNYAGTGYSDYVCKDESYNDAQCTSFKNDIRRKIKDSDIESLFYPHPDLLNECQFKNVSSTTPDNCGYEKSFLCTSEPLDLSSSSSRTFGTDTCNNLRSAFFSSGKIDSKYSCLLCNTQQNCHKKDCDNIKRIVATYTSDWENFICVDSTDPECGSIQRWLTATYPGFGYENYVCQVNNPPSVCSDFINQVRSNINKSDIDVFFTSRSNFLDNCAFKDSSSSDPDNCIYEQHFLCTDGASQLDETQQCTCEKYTVRILPSEAVDKVSVGNSSKLSDIETNMNSLISAVSILNSTGTTTAKTYFELARAGRGGSPVDCRIEGNRECPYAIIHDGWTMINKLCVACDKCFHPWRYTLEDYGKHVVRNLDSTIGKANKHGAIAGGHPDIFYLNKQNDDYGTEKEMMLNGSGSNFSQRDDNTGVTGSFDKYTYYSSYFKNNAKDNFTSFANLKKEGQSVAVFADEYTYKQALKQQSTLDALERKIMNFGENNGNEKDEFHSKYAEKFHVNNGTVSSGGAFWHRKASGAGGPGSSSLSIGDIYVKYVSSSSSSSGNPYLNLNGSGHMQIASESEITSGDAIKQCTVRCPPIYRRVKNKKIILPSKSEVIVDLICEYTGTPSTDMEPENSTNVYPKKCYIESDTYDKEYGSLKGKIIISSLLHCPLAKCKYGIWGEEALTGIVDDEAKKFDRKTMLCKPKDSGYEPGKTRTSLAYNYLFDKNIYSGMMYEGLKDEPLIARLTSDNTDHEIATCSSTDYDKYIYDKYDMIGTFGLVCANGFWQLSQQSEESFALYDPPENTNPKTNKVRVNSLGHQEPSNWYAFWTRGCGSKNRPETIPKDILYEDGRRSDEGLIYRDELYTENNKNMFNIDWVIRDHTYQLSDGTRTTGILNYDKYLDEHDIKDSVTGEIKTGRLVLDIACPPLSSDYDFDEYYAGNAEWPSADENTETVQSTKCKVSKDTFYFFQKDAHNRTLLPRRSCLRNGIWGPIFNPCIKGCMSEVDRYGTYWSLVDSLGNPIYTGTPPRVRVNGNCSSKYLNAQDIRSVSTTGYTRECDLSTGTWGPVALPTSCNDGITCLKEDSLTALNIPYPRILKLDNGSTYGTITGQLSSNIDMVPGYTTIETGIYFAFEGSKSRSSYISGLEGYNGVNSYLDVSINESAGISKVTDEYGNALFNNEGNTWYVITIKNKIEPSAMKYMYSANDEHNEFMNINRWMRQMKNGNANYTNYWDYKCNMTQVGSSIDYDNDFVEMQQRYKHANLKIYIPKAMHSGSECLNVKRIAAFSPSLATTIRDYASCSSKISSSEASIKFRMPIKLPYNMYDSNPACNFPNECSYLSASGDIFPIVVNNGAYNARLYDFVWTPKLNYDSSGRYVFQNWTNTTPTASANRDCNGKYLGYIKHNTMKHVVYTQRPSSEEMYFLSAFCYNGHILGLHGVKGIFPQLASKTVAVGDPSLTSTRDCFMANFIDNSPRRLYDEINAKYRKTHGGASIVDNGLYPIHKNAYIAAMTAKFWMAFLLPENDKQTEFKAHYEDDTNATVQYLKSEYSKGRDSYYYRIVPRRFEWVTNFGTGYSDSPLSSEMAALDEKDPYCTDTDCLDSKTDNNALNDYLRTNYTFGESMSGCV